MLATEKLSLLALEECWSSYVQGILFCLFISMYLCLMLICTSPSYKTEAETLLKVDFLKGKGSNQKVKTHMWPCWTTHGYRNVAVAKKYIVWVNMIDFSFMPKIIRISSKDHVAWRYLVNFLWLNLDHFKGDYLIIKIIILLALSDSRFSSQIFSYPNKPNIDGKLIYSACMMSH